VVFSRTHRRRHHQSHGLPLARRLAVLIFATVGLWGAISAVTALSAAEIKPRETWQ
jgi:hypothetical protein